MAKLTRLTAKIFGETASTTNTPKEIGQFGSGKAGTYNATGDVATIQSLPAWSNGWIDAVTPTDQFPPLPEMTGVHKVLSYQNAYVLQEGIPEYDANTTYYQNSICKGINSEDNLVFYKSLVDNNIGNALSDNNYWKELAFGGGSRNIGEIVSSTMPLTDAGLHPLDGSQLQYGSYKAFIDYIADLYNSGDYTAIFDTEANWQSAVTTYGVCGKFVYDSVNNTVRLPKYSNKIYTKDFASTAPAKGNGIVLGLTTGSGNYGLSSTSGTSGNGLYALSNAYGASAGPQVSGTGVAGAFGITTDSTKSGIIADLANITTALDGYYYIVVATSTKTNIQVDIDEIATDLNGKADVDLSNCTKPHIVETYANGTSWYRVYSDGWCEQGGFEGTGNNASVTLLKKYINTNYSVAFGVKDADGGSSYTPTILTQTTTGFTFYLSNVYDGAFWHACGYIS